MEASPVTRRLAAILAADVAGYSRLMAEDEEGTLHTLGAYRAAISDLIAEHGGRIFGTAGDSVIVEFASAVNSVRAAVAIQRVLERRNADLPEGRRMEFRIGINLGDVVAEGNDLLGDGVNVAARLQEVASPGGICISNSVHEQVEGKLQFPLTHLGDRSLKNILRPVSVYRVAWDTSNSPPKGAQRSEAPALPDKPSIAVLPFQNMSGDVEQDYFADGIVEDIITALSRSRWLFVIARNSSFTYKGRAVDVKQVGRELGVRYLLEGSVRKSGDRLRITGQLIDTSTGAHLWAERFDGGLEDVFDLQDQVTDSVVGTIAPKLEKAEIERAQRKPTESLDAYDYFLRGMAAFHKWDREGNSEALALFHRAIALDSNFASAYGMAARCFSQRKTGGWVTDRAYEVTETARLARRAGELGKDDAVALHTAGIALAYVVGDLDAGADFIDRALVLNPNLAGAWLVSGWVKVWLGEPEVAIERVARAMRLSPNDPQMFNMQNANAAANFFAGRYEEASTWAERSIREQPDYILSTSVAAAAGALAGNQVAAAKAISRLRQVMPALCISNLRDLLPIRRAEDFARWTEGMRKAGLPE
jgi:TolB-like protein/class 3 adenylate cyclase